MPFSDVKESGLEQLKRDGGCMGWLLHAVRLLDDKTEPISDRRVVIAESDLIWRSLTMKLTAPAQAATFSRKKGTTPPVQR